MAAIEVGVGRDEPAALRAAEQRPVDVDKADIAIALPRVRGGSMVSRSSCPALRLRSVCARYQLSCRPFTSAQRWAYRPQRWQLQRRDRPEADLSTEDYAEKLARIEAILFLSKEPLSSRKLAQHANLADGTEARTLVRRLNERLDQIGRSFRVQEIAGGFQLTTRRKFAKWLRRLDYVPSQERISAPALETLAVIAYRQPVMRADIEAVRGVSCGEILNQLMNRDLVRVGGRSSELGRPYLYNTTRRFLQVFGLRSLEELPSAEAFRRATIQPPTALLPSESDAALAKDSEVEEETDVSVSVELEQLTNFVEPTDMGQTLLDHDRVGERHVRMEDEDFDEEEEEFEDDDEFEDEELEEEELEEEEFEDEEFEDEDDEEFEEGEEEEFEEADEEVVEGEDEELEEEELEDEEFEEEEESEWEEVEEEEDDEEEDDEDWEEEDWEDEEEWEE